MSSRNQARVSSTTFGDFAWTDHAAWAVSMRVIAPLHPWFELRVTALQIQLEDGAKCTTRQEITILSAGLSKRSFVLTDPAARASWWEPADFPPTGTYWLVQAAAVDLSTHAVVGRYGAPFPPTSDLVDLHRTRSVTWLDGSS